MSILRDPYTSSFVACLFITLFGCGRSAGPPATVPEPAKQQRGWPCTELLRYGAISRAPSGSLYATAYVIASGGLRVRSEPHLSGKVVGLLPRSTRVEVLSGADPELTIDERKGCWVSVQTSELKGWAFSAYLDPELPRCLDLPTSRFPADFVSGCLGKDCWEGQCNTGHLQVYFREKGEATVRKNCHKGFFGPWRRTGAGIVIEGGGKDDFGCTQQCHFESISHDRNTEPCIEQCRARAKSKYGLETLQYRYSIVFSMASDGSFRGNYAFEEIGTKTGWRPEQVEAMDLLGQFERMRFECMFAWEEKD